MIQQLLEKSSPAGDTAEAVRKAIQVIQRAVRGDLEARILLIEEEGDLGELLHGINHLLDVTDAFAREARASMEFAGRGHFYRRVLHEGMLGTFLRSSQALNAATSEMERQKRALEQADKERRQAAKIMEEVVESIALSTVHLRTTATQLGEVSASGVKSANSLSESSEMASENIHTIAEATEEMAATVHEVQQMAQHAASNASGALISSNEAVDNINGLCEATTSIGQVVRAIGQVASQTRMLALNATIEAARAGDLGRGFSVVASEVKGLAHQTATATEDINRQIEGIQSSTTSVASIVGKVGQTILELNNFSGEIAEAVRQQKLATQDMSKNVHEAAARARKVFDEAQVVTRHANQTSQVADTVKEEAESLGKQVEILRRQAEGLTRVD